MGKLVYDALLRTNGMLDAAGGAFPRILAKEEHIPFEKPSVRGRTPLTPPFNVPIDSLPEGGHSRHLVNFKKWANMVNSSKKTYYLNLA
jgi:hypothetical protein